MCWNNKVTNIQTPAALIAMLKVTLAYVGCSTADVVRMLDWRVRLRIRQWEKNENPEIPGTRTCNTKTFLWCHSKIPRQFASECGKKNLFWVRVMFHLRTGTLEDPASHVLWPFDSFDSFRSTPEIHSDGRNAFPFRLILLTFISGCETKIHVCHVVSIGDPERKVLVSCWYVLMIWIMFDYLILYSLVRRPPTPCESPKSKTWFYISRAPTTSWEGGWGWITRSAPCTGSTQVRKYKRLRMGIQSHENNTYRNYKACKGGVQDQN